MATPANAQVVPSASAQAVPGTHEFTCGIDIGTKNLAISFLGIAESDGSQRVISYKGTLERMTRFEEDVETGESTFNTRGVRTHEAYMTVLCSIPEFSRTSNTVIELQLAMNRGVMARLDGIAFGFLRGRFPSMKVALNAATIRKKFIEDRVGEEEGKAVQIPKGYPPTKHQSMVYVGAKHPSYYTFIQSDVGTDKIDDICDSIVYASIAMLDYVTSLGKRVSKRR